MDELHEYQHFIDREPAPLLSTENTACKILFDPPELVQNGINYTKIIDTDDEYPPMPNKTQLISFILNDQQKKIKEQQEEIIQLKNQIAQLTNATTTANSNIQKI